MKPLPTLSPAPPWRAAVREVGHWLGKAPRSALLELIARFGFVARGLVYLSVGVLALLAALDLTPRAGGAVAAVAAWGRWPAGLLLIWLCATALLCFAVWRGVQSILDADGHGRSAKGLFIRVGQATSGVAHALLAWSLYEVLDGLDDLNERGDDAREMAAQALALPYGDWLLLGAGGVILAFGIGSVAQGIFQAFAKRLGCSARACRWAVVLARTGYVGRGLSFAPMGWLVLRAGLEARSAGVEDFAGALQSLEGQPFGSLLLGAAALGLLAFGAFALFEAAWRRIEAP